MTGLERTFPPQPVTDDEWALARQEGRWIPETIGAAEWTAQRLSEAYEELGEIKAEVAGYVAQVRAWAEDRLRTGRADDLLASIALFENGLRIYARRLRDESVDRHGEPRVKTIKLPSATLETVKARERKPKFAVVDMDALVEWAEEGAPDLIERTVNVKKLKLLVIEDENGQEFVVTADGERVPGVGFEWDEEPREPHVHIRLHTQEELTE